jgi:CheY-like chemotaxis protein
VGRTILVADDSPTVQKKASGILTGEGLDVVTVSNGVAAVKKLPSVNPLVVLADVSMPGKDGYEVCEHIKSNASLSHVSVILIFSDTDPYEEAKGSRVGADGKISKPFDRDELVATVAKFVAQSEAAAQKAAEPKAASPLAFEVEPIDAEPEVPVKQQSPDFSAFSEGMAFGVPPAEEIPAVPAEPMLTEPMSAEPIPSVEEPLVAAEGALEAFPEPSPTASEPEPALVSEPEVETVAPEAAEPMLVEEEPAPPLTPEPSGEATMRFGSPADIAQPIFSDELEGPAPVAEAEPPVVVESPTPVEAVPEPEPPPVAETTPVEAPAPEASAEITPAEGTPVAPSTLESYTLNEAAAGHVRFAPSETEAAHEPEPAPAEPTPEVAAAPEPPAPEPELAPSPPQAAAPPPAPVAAIDPAQVFTIVHKVVVKMSPPALSPQMIEDIARKFADEIVAELSAES